MKNLLTLLNKTIDRRLYLGNNGVLDLRICGFTIPGPLELEKRGGWDGRKHWEFAWWDYYSNLAFSQQWRPHFRVMREQQTQRHREWQGHREVTLLMRSARPVLTSHTISYSWLSVIYAPWPHISVIRGIISLKYMMLLSWFAQTYILRVYAGVHSWYTAV